MFNTPIVMHNNMFNTHQHALLRRADGGDARHEQRGAGLGREHLRGGPQTKVKQKGMEDTMRYELVHREISMAIIS